MYKRSLSHDKLWITKTMLSWLLTSKFITCHNFLHDTFLYIWNLCIFVWPKLHGSSRVCMYTAHHKIILLAVRFFKIQIAENYTTIGMHVLDKKIPQPVSFLSDLSMKLEQSYLHFTSFKLKYFSSSRYA